MFDLDAGKLIVIGIVALVAIPSKDLPRVLRQLGQWTAQARRMAAEFQGQLMEAIREADLEDAKRDVESAFDGAKQAASFDPLAATKKEIDAALEGPPAETPKQPEPEVRKADSSA
jgi:sec-independent protein translocase protein TatB